MATIQELLNLGLQHHQAGQMAQAEPFYREVLRVDPRNATAWHLLGVQAGQCGRHDVAVECIGQAIAIDGSDPVFHSNLGNAYRSLSRLDDAARSYQRAIELKPDFATACYDLGVTLQALGAEEEAMAAYRRALTIVPRYADAANNLGNLLYEQGHYDEAIECYRRGLEVQPDDAELHANLGAAYVDQGRRDEAAACYEQALRLQPDLAVAHFNRSLLKLLTGNLAAGWQEYEWRWQFNPRQRRNFRQPRWDGEPLPGQTILLHFEQGLGDTLHFVRYAREVKRRVGTVIVECQPSLASLVRTCPGVDQVVVEGDLLPAFDVYAPLMSLPAIFRTTLETVPAEAPYLFVDAQSEARWQAELGRNAAFKIGIVWQGDAKHRRNQFRSIPVRHFSRLAQLPSVRLYSLQLGPARDELDHLSDPFPIVDLASRLIDFGVTAAIVRNMDLVIACDTALAHLAGALGVPVWLALPAAPDWRWLLDRDDSPWYPTMRLFRQSAPGDWEDVFRRMHAALSERFPAES